MAKWYVQRGEKEFGPFEDKQLKQLAENGKLKPIDVVRRDDRQTCRPASEIKGLFPDANEPSDLPDLPEDVQPTEVPEPAQAVPQASTLQQMKESAATLTDYAKKQAKLKSLDLSEIPSALYALGSKALEHGVGKEAFGQLYGDISQIDSQVNELRSNKLGKSTDTITDKLKNASVATVNMAKIELLNRNRKKLVSQLGEQISANESVDADAILVSERQRVRDLNSQRDQLAREIADMDMGNKIKDGSKSLYEKRSILRPFVRHPAGIIVFSVGCFPVGLYLLWTQSNWPVARKFKWTAGIFAGLMLAGIIGNLIKPPVQPDEVGGSNLAANAAANERIEDKPDTAPSKSSEAQEVSSNVSRGALKGSFAVVNTVPDEMTLSKISYSKYLLQFTIHWHSSLGRPPWHWSAFDEDGTKVADGEVFSPRSTKQGTKFSGKVHLSGESINVGTLKRVVIHH